MNWDEIATKSPNAWFTHLDDWIMIETKWGVESYSFQHDDVGIIPLFLVKKKGFRYLTSGYKGWGGPAFIDNISARVAYYKIDELAKELKADWIEISLPSLIYKNNPLIDYEYKNIQGKTSIIDLRLDENLLYKNIDKKCRYEIRKQEKLGLNITFTEATSLEDIKEYYKLHCDNYNRTNTSANPSWYFEELWTRFYPKGIIKFFFIEEDGKKVAAASVAIWKGKAIYLTGASLEDARNKGLNHYLQWCIIKYLHKAGLTYYEMGEIDDSTEKARNLGRFKESFGGSLYIIYKGIKIYKPWKYKLYNILKRIKLWFSKK